MLRGAKRNFTSTPTPYHLVRSIGFSHECLGLHFGAVHFADLGDGGGKKPEQFLARQEYFPLFGTCWESVIGVYRSFPSPCSHHQLRFVIIEDEE